MSSTQYILLQSAELIADNQLLEYRFGMQRFKHKVDSVNELAQMHTVNEQ